MIPDLIAALAKAGAPMLGTVIGGPVGTLAGAAIGALADAFGTKATPEAVKEAIETRPDAAAIVQRVEAEKAPALNADLEAIMRDRQGARDQTIALVDKGSPIAWGAPIAMGRATSRKEATRRAEAAIRKARQETVSGRPVA